MLERSDFDAVEHAHNIEHQKQTKNATKANINKR